MRPQGSGHVGACLLVEREHRGGRVAKDQQGDGCSLRNGRRAVKGEERGQEITGDTAFQMAPSLQQRRRLRVGLIWGLEENAEGLRGFRVGEDEGTGDAEGQGRLLTAPAPGGLWPLWLQGSRSGYRVPGTDWDSLGLQASQAGPDATVDSQAN